MRIIAVCGSMATGSGGLLSPARPFAAFFREGSGTTLARTPRDVLAFGRAVDGTANGTLRGAVKVRLSPGAVGRQPGTTDMRREVVPQWPVRSSRSHVDQRCEQL